MSNEKREQQMMDAADRYADELCDESCTGAQVADTINDFCAGWRAADNSRWIPVEDELPKEENLYIVSNGRETSVAYWVDDNWDTFGDVITHWIQLPKPPRKEE